MLKNCFRFKFKTKVDHFLTTTKKYNIQSDNLYEYISATVTATATATVGRNVR